MDDIKIGSNRSFGLVFFIVFLIIAVWPLTFNGEIRIWSLLISIIFLILGLMNSKLLKPLNFLWFKFGLFLGRIISPIIMGIIYFFVATPIGLLMKLFQKNLLNLKKKKSNTYWIKKDNKNNKMKNQF
jgi:hypothetical protein|tara:strand:+ start:111 stop:494 length:384 start_codon:yes stop_codon:yes gene_type:complete